MRSLTIRFLACGLACAVASTTSAQVQTQQERDPSRRIETRTEATQQHTSSSKGLRVSQLMGMSVTNSENQPIGKIKDLVISNHGRIDYLVLEGVQTAEGRGQLTAVPFRALHFAPQGRMVSVDISADRLGQLPTFAADSYPDVNDREWRTRLNTLFGIEERQEIETEAGQPRQNRDRGGEPGVQPDRETRPQTPERRGSGDTGSPRNPNAPATPGTPGSPGTQP